MVCSSFQMMTSLLADSAIVMKLLVVKRLMEMEI
jgi:hypothetical protein